MTVAEEAPLGFAGDVDGVASFRIRENASGGFSATRAQRFPLPPSLEVEGLLGGGVVLTGNDAGRTVVTWRAQEGRGLWLEERGLDDDLEGGSLHLILQGAVSERGSVGIFGVVSDEGEDGDERSQVAVCVYTDANVVHRVTLQRPTCRPGERIPSVFTSMGRGNGCGVLKLSRGETIPSRGPCCWIKSDLLVVGGYDGNVHCVSILEDIDGQMACLTEEILKEKGGWIPLYSGGGGSAKTVAISGFWQEEEKRAVVVTLHSDWSLRVWTTTPSGARRGGGLAHRADIRNFLGASHQPRQQTAAMDEAGCSLSAIAGQEANGLDKRFVVAAVAAEGGLPVHVVLELPSTGVGLSQRAILEAPNDAGPLVDASVDEDLAVWALWARPRGHEEGGQGGITSYGRDGTSLDAVENVTIDEWLSAQRKEQDVIFDDLLQKHDWEGLTNLRSPGLTSDGGVHGKPVVWEAVDMIEGFYLRRIFTPGRFGRRALCSAIREALPLLSAAGPLSSNSTSLQDLEALALDGVRGAAGQALTSLEEAVEENNVSVVSQTAQEYLATVHGRWKSLLEVCVRWGHAEARPLGLAPGGRDEFGAPVVVRAGRICCLLPLSLPANLGPSRRMSVMTRASTRSMMSSRLVDEQQLRLESLRGVAGQVPRALEKVAAESAGVWPGTAAAVMRVFDEESAFAREGSAGGLGRVDRPRDGAGQEADGASYKRLQMSFLRKVTDDLQNSALGVELVQRVAAELRADAEDGVLSWVESLEAGRRMELSRLLRYRGSVRGRSACVATAAAFGALKTLRQRSVEARSTAVLLMLLAEHVERVGLAVRLRHSILDHALPLALKYMNQYALAADVGSQRLRPRGNGGPDGQIAMEEARKPWGCSVLEGIFLTRRDVVQGYWAARCEDADSRRRLREGLAGLPALLASMCEKTTQTPWKGLDNGGLAAFLQDCQQYQLSLPVVGFAVKWRQHVARLDELDAEVLKALARGFLASAEAVACSGKWGNAQGPCLLKEVTGWFSKAEQSLETAIKRGVNGAGDRQRVEHFEACLAELEEVRQRVKRAGNGGGGCKVAGDLFGKAGALSALELACSALWRDREIHPAGEEMEQSALQQRARLCQLVFKHASEALKFDQAFDAIRHNPFEQRREENLRALTQHMCESGRLGELCKLALEDDGYYGAVQPSAVVRDALCELAEESNVAELVRGTGDGRLRTNYFDCLYAFFITRGELISAAEAQDELRKRLEEHSAGSTLPFAAAAQRARFAALNALAAAPPAVATFEGDRRDVTAALFPPRREATRRLDANGQPAEVRTTSSLARAAAIASAAIDLAEERLQVSASSGHAAENGGANGAPRARRLGSANGVGSSALSASHNAEEAKVITGVSKVLEALADAGRFEQAADVALRGLGHQPKAMHAAMDKIVIAVAKACALAEDIVGGFSRDPLPPLVRGVGPLKPRFSTWEASEASERVESLWLVLKQLLRLDSAANNFSYHAKAAEVLLEEMPACRLPSWLEDSFLGRSKASDPPANANAFPQKQPRPLPAPWKAFTPGGEGCVRGANPTALLDLYVLDGRLEDACLFLSRLLDTDITLINMNILSDLTPEKRGGTDWLPYASIERLLTLCEASLARNPSTAGASGNGIIPKGPEEELRRKGRDGLEKAFQTAQERLVGYFKVAKVLTDHVHARRKAKMVDTSPVATSFMLTD